MNDQLFRSEELDFESMRGKCTVVVFKDQIMKQICYCFRIGYARLTYLNQEECLDFGFTHSVFGVSLFWTFATDL
jgi:hypothetical protein